MANRTPEAILEELLHSQEGEVLEFKDRKYMPSDDEMGKYFSALSNEANLHGQRSAWMVFGVTDKDRTVVCSRYKDTPESLNNLKRYIYENTSGNLSYTHVHEVTVDSKRILLFEIPAAKPGTPTRFKRSAWERQGDGTYPMSDDKYERILAQTRGSWTDAPADGVSVRDVDNYVLDALRKRGHTYKRITDEEMKLPAETFLRNMGLVRGDIPTRAAAILFGRDPLSVSRAACIRIGRITGKSKLLFQDDLEGPLYTLIDRAIDLILTKYTVTPFEFRGMTRIEHYPYPPAALREALLNAVINTDFRQALPVKIDVLDDRINIFNSGSLPPGYSVDELAEGHISKPLNDGLATAFYRSYYVEKFGMGMLKMREEYEAVGVSPPKYTVHSDGIMVTLADILHEKGLAPSGAAGSLLEINGRKIEFTENQIMALRFMKKHGETTNEDLQNIIGLKRERIRTTVIRPLLDTGFIEMTEKSNPRTMNQSYVLSKQGLTIIFND